MASVFRSLCIGALLVASGACHHEGDSAVLRFITSSGGGGEDDGEDGGEDGGEGGSEIEKGSPEDSVCGYRTQTQGGWSTTCTGMNPGCARDKYFELVFYDDLTIGCGANTAVFANTFAVRKALPTGGKPRALLPGETRIYHGLDDPKIGTVLAGQAIALSLNVGFSAVDEFVSQDLTPFPSLLIADEDSPCHGMSVQDALDEVNRVLGDCYPSMTPDEANQCATRINESFVDGEPQCSTWYRDPWDPRHPLAEVPTRDDPFGSR